jgi:hypothetical protein
MVSIRPVRRAVEIPKERDDLGNLPFLTARSAIFFAEASLKIVSCRNLPRVKCSYSLTWWNNYARKPL